MRSPIRSASWCRQLASEGKKHRLFLHQVLMPLHTQTNIAASTLPSSGVARLFPQEQFGPLRRRPGLSAGVFLGPNFGPKLSNTAILGVLVGVEPAEKSEPATSLVLLLVAGIA